MDIACRSCNVSVLLVSTLGRENVRLYRIDSNTSYVIKEVVVITVLAIHNDTFVHDGTCLHGYARSRVGYGTWNILKQCSNAMLARMEEITKNEKAKGCKSWKLTGNGINEEEYPAKVKKPAPREDTPVQQDNKIGNKKKATKTMLIELWN